MNADLSRRHLLATSTAALGAGLAASALAQQGVPPTPPAAQPLVPPQIQAPADTFVYCLNTSTIRGQKLSLVEEIDLAAKAGYHAIEPWINEIDTYLKGGGKLPDIKKRCGDLGLSVEDAIGFPQWIVDDDAKRAAALEQVKREMDWIAQLGGKRIAAPPVGAQDKNKSPKIDLLKAAERYKALADVGEQMGVTPMVEMWGFSPNLSKLGEVTLVAAESGHRKACVLPDVYHFHKGGSAFDGLRLLSASAVQVLHMNDYPAEPAREQIADRHRIYPGDGVAPLATILRDLHSINPKCILSLELFNPDYWKQDAAVVAKTGLQKMKAAVAKIFAVA
jgi:2-keto-myo-inositol isomerase